jgi:hypothetical protein
MDPAMEHTSDEHTLNLYDPDEDKTFEIRVSKEDYKRALNGEEFEVFLIVLLIM